MIPREVNIVIALPHHHIQSCMNDFLNTNLFVPHCKHLAQQVVDPLSKAHGLKVVEPLPAETIL